MEFTYESEIYLMLCQAKKPTGKNGLGDFFYRAQSVGRIVTIPERFLCILVSFMQVENISQMNAMSREIDRLRQENMAKEERRRIVSLCYPLSQQRFIVLTFINSTLSLLVTWSIQTMAYSS